KRQFRAVQPLTETCRPVSPHQSWHGRPFTTVLCPPSFVFCHLHINGHPLNSSPIFCCPRKARIRFPVFILCFLVLQFHVEFSTAVNCGNQEFGTPRRSSLNNI